MRRHALLADTGPLYASIDPDDQFHRRAQDEGVRLAAEGYSVVIAYPTLFESYSLVYQRIGNATAHSFLSDIRERSGLLSPTPDDYSNASRVPGMFPDQRVSLFDALVAVLSERLDLAIWTYDTDFDVLQANVWRS